MSYISEGDLENFILQDIDSSYSTWITSIIAAVEAYIDQYCGTDFENSGSGDKYYDGNGTDELFIGNVQTITAVYFLDVNGNVESTLGTGDWNLYPLNDSTKNTLKLSGGGSYSSFPNRSRAVKITGTFGNSTAPLPVKMAGVQLAAKLINEGLRGGQVKSESLGSYSVTYKDIDENAESMAIKETLNQYRIMTLD